MVPRPLLPSLRRSALTALAVAFCLSAAVTARAKVFEPETFTLENGLQVVVISNHRAPIVNHMVWYKVGAADEPRGKSGIAHFLEHLMFKGTETLGPGEFSEIIARNGGKENAFTSWDYTGYFQTVAKDRLETMMEHEADRMTGLVLTDEVVDPERLVVIEERSTRTDNEPQGQLAEMVSAVFYLNHPYRLPIIGWRHEIEGLTTEDALAFYRAWYRPNNAILILEGDVTAEEVRPLVEKHYGPIEAGAPIERVRLAEPPHEAPRRVTLESPRVQQPSLWIEHLAPSYRTAEGNEAYALQVLNEILGGGPISRLYRGLVVEQGLAASAGSGYGPSSYDPSSFRLYVSPRPGVELAAAEAALRAEIDKLLEQGVTEEEVAGAKQRMAAAAVYARDRLGTAGNIFGRALTAGQTVEDVEAWPERIAAVTADQVNAAARAVLRAESSVTAELLPEPTT